MLRLSSRLFTRCRTAAVATAWLASLCVPATHALTPAAAKAIAAGDNDDRINALSAAVAAPHEALSKLIDALLEQEDSGDGITPVKVSHNRSDRVSSSVDALRYGLWAIFHGGQSTAVLVDGAGMLG